MKGWALVGLLGAVGGVGALWWSSSAQPSRLPPPPVEDAEPPDELEGDEEREDMPGKWRKARPAAQRALTSEQQLLVEALEAIGYADGTQAVRFDRMITVHDRERAWQGYNFWYSGHASEAYLSDMDGEVLWTWRANFPDVFADSRLKEGAPGTHHWRRARLTDDGDVYGIWEGRGLVRLSADSTVKASWLNNAHHDMVLLPDGGFLVLTRQADLVPAWNPDRPVAQDFIEQRDATGALVRRVSILQALLDGGYEAALRASREPLGDVTHTNSLFLLDGSLARVRPEMTAGRVLVSMRHLDSIGVVDLDAGKFVWLYRDRFGGQHDARVVEPGWIQLFDNVGMQGKHSRVLAYEPSGLQVAWEYAAERGRRLWSGTLGTAQKLPNGNVLITESDGGRALEVTADHQIVWEMYNPHRAGEGGEFIAALFEVIRLPPDTDLSWMRR